MALAQAIDLAQPLTPAQILAASKAGVEALCRYLWAGGKGLTLAEARAATAANMKLVVVYEGRGDRYSSFTAAQGSIDAHHAIVLAQSLGIPKGATIYFCGDDFDATGSEIAGGILAYVKAASPVIRGAGFRFGVYGNGAMCKAMLDANLADNAWVWGAMGTNGTAAFVASNRWSIRQHPTVREFGVSVDPDEIQGDYGGFLVDLPKAA